ncbi:MAG TPA: hypothetical protein VGM10_24650 [Actinocrinis sp.]|jgi:hypothetical protein
MDDGEDGPDGSEGAADIGEDGAEAAAMGAAMTDVGADCMSCMSKRTGRSGAGLRPPSPRPPSSAFHEPPEPLPEPGAAPELAPEAGPLASPPPGLRRASVRNQSISESSEPAASDLEALAEMRSVADPGPAAAPDPEAGRGPPAPGSALEATTCVSSDRASNLSLSRSRPPSALPALLPALRGAGSETRGRSGASFLGADSASALASGDPASASGSGPAIGPGVHAPCPDAPGFRTPTRVVSPDSAAPGFAPSGPTP